ncbi:phospho-sugar mutase [Aldersonia sp. NBC_00410]|uniref:phospho-sugar mutase n=1 Tax=Aldersonia sp. NBC_00410 TaxID=2975954 RepID=UPI00224CFF35|nr:phospho-sugar mutase [Aldersonia sp. NBC_00410]MCX5044478.1 phospho-sugar mutase [Aldersonia sp. NBC_00410]
MSLRFGTAGLRGPLRDGPDGMNPDVVTRATAGLAAWLQERCLGGGVVVVGYDARHGSREFGAITAEVLAAAGFAVRLFPRPLPTPLTAFAVRALDAVAGVQITASHNPATDNGYKVFVSGGAQLISPADREIEAKIDAVGPAAAVPRSQVEPIGDELVERYLARVASLPHGTERNVRIALTPLHGVGGETALAALRMAGFTDLHVVDEQYQPDPDFPTVAFPNPEEAGATDLLLTLAERVDADLAVALDPDADRCALGVRDADGWRMLRGDETGALLGEHVLATAPADALVASTVVSSRLLGKLARARGARHAETLTGFKWLVRAGDGLVYAYEEALGHCVDPDAVRDKDGISAAVLAADLAAGAKERGTTLPALLDDLAREFGLHATDQVSRRVDDLGVIEAIMAQLRSAVPTEVAGEPVEATDLLQRRGLQRTDALILTGARSRIVVRPSGTEPKLKCYLEVVERVAGKAELTTAHVRAVQRLGELRSWCEQL